MSDTPYKRKRDFYGTVSGNTRVVASATGVIVLVPAIPGHTIYVQQLHVEVTTPIASATWVFQDGAGIAIRPAVSAAAIAHFDFDFGPDGVPCSEATAFVLNIPGPIGAVGWVSWEAYKQLPLIGAPTNYAAIVLADRPQGFWRLGDPVGSGTALDSSGHGFTGAVNGGVTFGQSGAIAGNGAALFDGATCSITTPAPITASCSGEAWINPAAIPTGGAFPRILSSGNNFPFELGYALDQGVYIFVNFVGLTPGWILATPGNPLPLNAWAHVAMTWDGTTLRVYLNGQPTYTNAIWAGKVLQSGAVVIGGIFGGANSWWSGKLDDVAIYDYALTPAQIAKHFSVGMSR